MNLQLIRLRSLSSKSFIITGEFSLRKIQMTAVKRKPPLSVYDVKRRNRAVKLTSPSRNFRRHDVHVFRRFQ